MKTNVRMNDAADEVCYCVLWKFICDGELEGALEVDKVCVFVCLCLCLCLCSWELIWSWRSWGGGWNCSSRWRTTPQHSWFPSLSGELPTSKLKQCLQVQSAISFTLLPFNSKTTLSILSLVRSVEARVARRNSLANVPHLLDSDSDSPSGLMLARRSLSDRFKLQVNWRLG